MHLRCTGTIIVFVYMYGAKEIFFYEPPLTYVVAKPELPSIAGNNAQFIMSPTYKPHSRISLWKMEH